MHLLDQASTDPCPLLPSIDCSPFYPHSLKRRHLASNVLYIKDIESCLNFTHSYLPQTHPLYSSWFDQQPRPSLPVASFHPTQRIRLSESTVLGLLQSGSTSKRLLSTGLALLTHPDLSKEALLICRNFLTTSASIEIRDDSAYSSLHLGVFFIIVSSNLGLIPKHSSPRLDSSDRFSLIEAASKMSEIDANVSISKLLQDLGYVSTYSDDSLQSVFQHAGISTSNASETFSESHIASVLRMMAQTVDGLSSDLSLASTIIADLPDEAPSTWDASRVITNAVSLGVDIDWIKLGRALDSPELDSVSPGGYNLIVNAIRTGVGDSSEFPLAAFLEPWENPQAQFGFLKELIENHPVLVTMNKLPLRKAIVFEALPVALPFSTNSIWNSVDVVESLCRLSAVEADGLSEQVKLVLDQAATQSPEVLLIALSQIPPPWTTLTKDFSSNLALMFLAGHVNSAAVLPRVWQASQSLVINGLLLLYSKDPALLSRILDVTQETKSLSQVLETKSYPFALDLASLASRRDYLNFEKWLLDHIREDGDLFVRACLEFLNEKFTIQSMRQEGSTHPPVSVPLSVEVVTTYFRVLSSLSAMSPENAEIFRNVFSLGAQLYPRIVPLAAPPEESIVPGGSLDASTFSPDVEDETSSYYNRIFKGDMSIPQTIDLLQGLKGSANPRDQEVFKCMIQNLFGEYKFFAEYPDKALLITSCLFGSLIRHQIVNSMALGIALRYVLDGLRQPINSKLFTFGMNALLQFESRLAEWPQYCGLLVQIPHLHERYPDLIQRISTLSNPANVVPGGITDLTGQLMDTKAKDELPKDIANGIAADQPPEEPVVFTALRIESLIINSEQFSEVPPEAVQDKILFIVNNIVESNMEEKYTEIREYLHERYFRWFSHYLVVKRASIEPNNHKLYIRFLDYLACPLLDRHILLETYSNIRVLLNSEKTVTSSSERTLLKNLGFWLGGVTLAKNIPIKHKHLAFKDLLLEGYDHNRLIVVIPFVCKVLEQVMYSTVFRPPNPWFMAIMKLLSELYYFADLKLNLKFEIEVLCNKLGIKLDIKEITPTSLLEGRPIRSGQAAMPYTAPRPNGASAAPLDSAVPRAPTSTGSAIPDAPQMSNAEEESAGGFPHLAAYITLNHGAGFFNLPEATLKRIVYIAMDRAIREIILPVVERSVTIASIATRELVVKDFAFEPNEDKMRKAGHMIVQNLAGSLASVTCREPLKMSMMQNMRLLLAQAGFAEQSVPDQAIYVTVADNLDLACSVIEKTAAEKAIPDIDDGLSAAYHNRRKHRERSTQPYYDVAVYTSSRYLASLPDMLRPKLGGLTPQQMRVYEEFARPLPRAFAPAQGMSPASMRPQQHVSAVPVVDTYTASAPYDDVAPLNAQQAQERFSTMIAELSKIIMQTPSASLGSFPAHHDIRLLLRQIPHIVVQSYERDQIALVFSQKVVQLLYKSDSSLSREVNIYLLERLCELSKRVAKEVSAWLLYADDERKFNVPVTVALIQQRMLNTGELDVQLSRFIESGRATAIDFTAELIRVCIADDSAPVATYHDFFSSIDALYKSQRSKSSESVSRLMAELQKRGAISKEFAPEDSETLRLREQFTMLFTEWVRLYHFPGSNDKASAAFITQLQQQGILKNDDLFYLFFRVCTEVSVESYIKNRSTNGSHHLAYQGVDALARMIVLLIRDQEVPASGAGSVNTGRLALMTKILSIIVLVLVHSHEQRRNHFNQRPFFRLFSMLLNDINVFESQFQVISFQILSAMSNTFHTLRPQFLPGFAFSWLQLISHRFFMSRLLLAENQKGWPLVQKLLVDLFMFIGPFLKQNELTETIRLLYKGTLRVLLVLLHDFPEFLCGYHFSFVDVIPHSCIQLRNLILSAFPRNMRLPDPFTPNLKVDQLPEVHQHPHIMSDFTANLLPNNFKQEIETYLKNRSPTSFLIDLQSKLLRTTPPSASDLDSSRYNIPVINALVLLVGTHAIASLAGKQSVIVSQQFTAGAPLDIFQHLAADLDTEGRYLLFSAIANQLRYPNSHTHYFSCVMLFLFAEASEEIIQEQITRVLLERLIANRPHPYGILVTFIELLRNPRYSFWTHSGFIRCAPEIERLFQTVGKSVFSASNYQQQQQ
ncbi:CCR4-Not complex component, Not1-domain-containing protein [Polychytrium aggregatum]|uniref:CCR4-Not complex component, Not1-domain-containing protein n=1 Tax=Polychytrium aggregatum TaxID=110093 RepID=UPI0022FEA4FD|nr:CCR4-Not complex component, Not1-domain-containing protein [Polychytrium aggregatum]KAI9209788.1 CCR4-Not complex component, Not1-domain-containing protein [Polychytrium aggregatum]